MENISTETNSVLSRPEIWGGIECTINRVGNKFSDQLKYAGHYNRTDDIEKICALGIKKLRYPVLWEFHEPEKDKATDWDWVTMQLEKIRRAGVIPIAGLLHHGSGPSYTRLDDDNFPRLLAEYAAKVARQFPWLEYYTPVNEPLTTARFSGLYGHWYPHAKSGDSFVKMLLNQVKGIILSMRNIRKINPAAKLVQTEDLAFTHSTDMLKYQANFENERRWLTYDLLCGKMDRKHIMWNYMVDNGASEKELLFFVDNPCPPDIIGLNYYVTSERWLDEKINLYPAHTHGGNGRHRYADTEAVRFEKQNGPGDLLQEAWHRYNIPLAITECHLSCSREEQLRWLNETWTTCEALVEKAVNVTAFTAWSMLGAFNWNSLLTRDDGHYETGVFDVTNDTLRPTALAKQVHALANLRDYEHPLLQEEGWWNRGKNKKQQPGKKMTPLLIIGKTGTLGNAFMKMCDQRAVPYIALTREEISICESSSIERAIDSYGPWAIINATGFVRVDDAETQREECFRVNSEAPKIIGKICAEKSIPFMTFSSDLVFDGCKNSPYLEEDEVKSLNVYGTSKARGEKLVQQVNPRSLVIRTSGFFGPWDKYNFVYNVLETIKAGQTFEAANDIVTSPTYVPDLVNAALDLFIDEESGIWHITNDGMISWAEFAKQVAHRGGYTMDKVQACASAEMNWKARRPLFSALQSEKGLKLPSLENALERYFQHQPI